MDCPGGSLDSSGNMGGFGALLTLGEPGSAFSVYLRYTHWGSRDVPQIYQPWKLTVVEPDQRRYLGRQPIHYHNCPSLAEDHILNFGYSLESD